MDSPRRSLALTLQILRGSFLTFPLEKRHDGFDTLDVRSAHWHHPVDPRLSSFKCMCPRTPLRWERLRSTAHSECCQIQNFFKSKLSAAAILSINVLLPGWCRSGIVGNHVFPPPLGQWLAWTVVPQIDRWSCKSQIKTKKLLEICQVKQNNTFKRRILCNVDKINNTQLVGSDRRRWGDTVLQSLSKSSHSEKVASFIPGRGRFLEEFVMFSLCLHGFLIGSPAFPPQSKTCLWGAKLQIPIWP